MKRLLASVACALGSLAVSVPATAEPRVVRYGGVPEAIRTSIENEWRDCRSSTQLSQIRVTQLDINDDGHADYLFMPSVEMRGTSGYCSSNWVPVLLWAYQDDGGYVEVVLGSSNAILRRGSIYITTANCSGTLSFGGVSLAVFQSKSAEIISFGRCYGDMSEAIASARSLGFDLVRLDAGK